MGSTSKRMFTTAGNEKKDDLDRAIDRRVEGDPDFKRDLDVAITRQNASRKFAGPKSPHDLIQEHYRDDPQFEWKVLVCCMMLNQTSRKQLDQVVVSFFEKWSNPFDLLIAVPEDIEETIRSLGFKSMRTKRLLKMSDQFMEAKKLAALERGEGASLTSEQVAALYGVGVYAHCAWQIFCAGELGITPPDDHSLVKYWRWATENKEEYDKGWV